MIPRPYKKKMEFSKKIFIGVTIATTIVTIFTLIMVWKTCDLTILAYLIPAVFAELGAATGFYYKKAEKENTKGGIIYDLALLEHTQDCENNKEGELEE